MQITPKNDALVVSKGGIKSGWEGHTLFLSDVHFDAKHCDRRLFKEHLERAKAKGAKIFIVGDFFDAMGGKWDKRSTKADIRPDYNTAHYFDDIIDDAAAFLKPYTENIAMISMGNHESSVLLRHETNLTGRLCRALGPTVFDRKYAGFIRFQFEAYNIRTSKTLFYTHGAGGSSPVTRGVIQSQRRQHDLRADIYVSGHTHSEWNVPRPYTKLNEQCNVEVHKCHHISLGCYKQDHLEGGWADHKGFGAASIGAAWIRWFYKHKALPGKTKRNNIDFEVTLVS
jgi:predicted phosphodiesterase